MFFEKSIKITKNKSLI